jgi:hypothetical protein
VTRRSLHVATNYVGTPYALAGCIQDANDLEDICGSRRYQTQSLLEGDATRANVLPLLADLVDRTKYGDILIAQFSGHGAQVPNRNGTEIDGYDESICLSGFERDGVTGDDELHAIFTKRHYGARILFFSDSCFAGGLARGLVDTQGDVRRGRPRFIDGADLSRAVPRVKKRVLTRNPGVLLSGSAESEVSYDAWFPGPDGKRRANGAMTRAAIDTWTADSTMGQWHKRLRVRLPSETFPQSPRLVATFAQRTWRLFD